MDDEMKSMLRCSMKEYIIMSNKIPQVVSIQAHGLPDAWHKAIG